MLPSDLVRRATATLMRNMNAINTDIADQTRAEITKPIPQIAGMQGTYTDGVLDRLIKLHDELATNQLISNDDITFLILSHFKAVAEIQKLQAAVDRLAGQIFKQSIERMSLAGRS